MTLPDAPWSIKNPGVPPIIHKPEVPVIQRVQAALDKAVSKIKAEHTRKPMTREERRVQADDLRKQADWLERQQ